MLIQFTVSNYRSIREAQTLSMVAAPSLKRLRDRNSFAPEARGQNLPNLLRCAAVFGPNAAGKSNLVKALRFVATTVLQSADAKPEPPISVQPFRLNSESAKDDSTFEIEFIEEGTRYQFGFSANRARISQEWLIAYATSRPTELYRRQFDADSQQDTYIFGRGLEGGRLRKDWAAQTGPKTLFLSRVVQASSEEFKQLRAPYRWFSRRLRVDRPPRVAEHDLYTSEYCESEEGRRKVLDFLNALDIPITGIEIRKRKIDFGQSSSPFTPEFMKAMNLDTELTMREPIFTHTSQDGSSVEFGASDESDGTMNLYSFAAKWIEVVEQDFVLVVDELDSSLHPLAVWELIRQLCESKSRAQLIFTTHDVTVLRSKLLRRDQIFFVSPNSKRESQLYSLLDFKGREDDAFEDRYLQGRYGATPVIGR